MTLMRRSLANERIDGSSSPSFSAPDQDLCLNLRIDLLVDWLRARVADDDVHRLSPFCIYSVFTVYTLDAPLSSTCAKKKKKHKKILDKPDEDLYNKKDKVMKAR